jgi:hypothetical protein
MYSAIIVIELIILLIVSIKIFPQIAYIHGGISTLQSRRSSIALRSFSKLPKIAGYYEKHSNKPYDSFFIKLDEVIQTDDPTSQLLQISLYDRKVSSKQTDLYPELQTVHGRLVDLKAGIHLQLTYRSRTNDVVKNYSLKEIESVLKETFQRYSFCKATIKTVKVIWELNLRGSGKFQAHPNAASPLIANLPSLFPSSISTSNQPAAASSSTPAAQVTAIPSQILSHDRIKPSLIDPSEEFLKALKVVSVEGKPYMGMSDKLRQIQKFIEIMDTLIGKSDYLPSNHHLRIVDMGCGLGYLTFAMHRYFNQKYASLETIGIENRAQLVHKTQDIARSLGKDFKSLSFEVVAIEQYDSLARPMDILVALHACDMATDDAIYRGIQANASIIVVAPCCQKEIRLQLDRRYLNASTSSALSQLSDVMRHGIYRERQAEMITDSIRALALEYAGYEVKVMEFIGGEHTAKNVMITAVKKIRGDDEDESERSMSYRDRIVKMCEFYDLNGQSLIQKIGIEPATTSARAGASKPVKTRARGTSRALTPRKRTVAAADEQPM